MFRLHDKLLVRLRLHLAHGNGENPQSNHTKDKTGSRLLIVNVGMPVGVWAYPGMWDCMGRGRSAAVGVGEWSAP